MNQKLEAKIKATNRANQYANELYPKLAAIFGPLVGQKIIKADGRLLSKVESLLPQLPSNPSLQVYRDSSSNYSLAWIVQASEPDSDMTVCYAKTTVYIGKLQDGILKNLDNPQIFRTNFNAEEVEKNRLAIRAAKRVLDDALSALYPFGEYDR